MLKGTGIRLLALAAMVSILFIAQVQAEEQGWKKTITLPSGEVVCDLNGEWDVLWIGRGENHVYGRIRYVVKITQQGDSFEAIRMIGNAGMRKGTVAIEGELDKNGFKRLMYNGAHGTAGPYKGKISKDGNVIEINANNLFDLEFTRK